MKAKVVRVIRTERTEGDGSIGRPFRNVTSYFTLDGQLLLEQDLYRGGGE